MKIRSGAALLAAASLCACNGGAGNNQAANGSANSSSTNSAAATSTSSTTADPNLERDVKMAAEIIRPQLPMKQDNGVTFTAVEANGPELLLEMQVPGDMDQAKFEQLQEQLPVIACNNPQAQETFRRGGTYTYRIVDPGGETFTASVNRCATQ